MKPLFVLLCFTIFPFLLIAQGSRWLFGVGTNVHITNYDLGNLDKEVIVAPVLRQAGGFYARYALKKGGKFKWGPFQNRLKFYVDTGVNFDFLAYSYEVDGTPVTQDFMAFEWPIHLVFIGDAKHLPFFMMKGLRGYGRIGANLGFISTPEKNYSGANWAEKTVLSRIRNSLYVSAGVCKVDEKYNRISSLGFFSKMGANPVAEGTLSGARFDEPLTFKTMHFQVGIESFYFFGSNTHLKNWKDRKPAILCPHF